MLVEIWRENRDDVKTWSIQWRSLTAEELHDFQQEVNPAAGLPMLRGVDAAGNLTAQISRRFDLFAITMSRA